MANQVMRITLKAYDHQLKQLMHFPDWKCLLVLTSISR